MESAWGHIERALAEDFADFADVGRLTQLCLRLIVAGFLGSLLGWEREKAHKAAGLRTHMLVAVGAALFTLVPLQVGMDMAGISRVLQGLVAGIGFLGAGAILKLENEDRVHGLTTAAGIWLTAAVGIAAGLGRLASAMLGTCLALLILTVVRRLEDLLHRRQDREKLLKK